MNALGVKDLLRDGLQGILLHRMRSLLSATGILFGVGAVIGILSIGEGARREQEQLISQLGILNFQIQASYPEEEELKEEIWRISQGLSSRDVSALREALPDLTGIGGMKSLRIREVIPRPRKPVQVIGAEPAWLSTTTLRRLQGRGLRRSASSAPAQRSRCLAETLHFTSGSGAQMSGYGWSACSRTPPLEPPRPSTGWTSTIAACRSSCRFRPPSSGSIPSRWSQSCRRSRAASSESSRSPDTPSWPSPC